MWFSLFVSRVSGEGLMAVGVGCAGMGDKGIGTLQGAGARPVFFGSCFILKFVDPHSRILNICS